MTTKGAIINDENIDYGGTYTFGNRTFFTHEGNSEEKGIKGDRRNMILSS